MSNIVAYDKDGKPLRPGDKVLLLDAGVEFKHRIGKTYTVKEACREPILMLVMNSVDNLFRIEERFPECPQNPIIEGTSVRRIDEDSQKPSNQSYEELINNLKSQKPITQ